MTRLALALCALLLTAPAAAQTFNNQNGQKVYGTVTALQGGSWSISLAPSTGTIVTTGTITAWQGGRWLVGQDGGVYTVTPGSGTWVVSQIGAMTVTPGTGTWNVTGSSIVSYQGGAWSASASQNGVFTVTAGTGAWSSSQIGSYVVTPGTGVWSVSGSSVMAFQAGAWSSGISSGTNSAIVTSSGSLRAYIPAPYPRVYASSLPIILSNVVDTSLVSLSFSGEIEFLTFNFDRANVIVSIVVDGFEIFREELVDMNSATVYNLSDTASTAGQSPVIVSRLGKQLWFKFTSPKGVGSSLSVRARKTVVGATSMLGGMVVYGVTR